MADEEALDLSQQAVDLAEELLPDPDPQAAALGKDHRLEELLEVFAEAKALLSENKAAEALRASIRLLEVLLLHAHEAEVLGQSLTGALTHGRKVRSRIGEILWIAKDALALFKESEDIEGRAVTLKALARIHLCRSDEPDAPLSALKCGQEALELFRTFDEPRREAEALCAVADAHVATAAATPFEKVREDELEEALQDARDASSLFGQLGDKISEGRALHAVATALLGVEDEEQVMEGERMAEDARELFIEAEDPGLEMVATMTIINARTVTSGSESALAAARNAIADWTSEGNRPVHLGLALCAAGKILVNLGEVDEAMELGLKAKDLFAREGQQRGVASSLFVIKGAYAKKENVKQAVTVLKEAVDIYQRVDDKGGEGRAYMMLTDLLLTKLAKEVEADTTAMQANKHPVVGLSVDDVYKRGAEGLEFAEKAVKCFEAIGDTEGQGAVGELVQTTFDKAVSLYCDINEPDHIYTTLEADGRTEADSTYEWKIELPSLQKKAEEAKAQQKDPKESFITVRRPKRK